MTNPSPPLIEFPCAYPIKVMGLASETFMADILAIFDQHAPGYNRQQVQLKASSKGTFSSVHVVITAEGESHIQTLFVALKQVPAVRMVL